MQDERRLERTLLIYRLRVFDSVTGTLLGHVVDMNSAGMMRLGREAMEVGAVQPVRIALPANATGGGAITVETTVKWSRKIPDGQFFSSGLETGSITPETSRTIAMLISQFYQESEEEDPLAGVSADESLRLP